MAILSDIELMRIGPSTLFRPRVLCLNFSLDTSTQAFIPTISTYLYPNATRRETLCRGTTFTKRPRFVPSI